MKPLGGEALYNKHYWLLYSFEVSWILVFGSSKKKKREREEKEDDDDEEEEEEEKEEENQLLK